MHVIPKTGRSKQQILEEMQTIREQDIPWRQGKVFSLVFDAGEEVNELLKQAYNLFFSENGLNPTAFPSLRKFEAEVVAMSAALLGGGPQVVGNMTSGGTESILMAVKTARDWSRIHRPHIQQPEMILPLSAHPAFDKAAYYFDVKIVRTPTRADLRANVDAVQEALSEDTILIVASAPSYPHGVVDPISEIASIAQEHQVLFHVDACVGGFLLPFARRLGYPIPEFDFSVPGVTSMSADLHKYAYAAKGASVILYRDGELRRHQFFAHADWPGGIYASPTMTGTRPGGAIAAAWAVMNFLGEEGYTAITQAVMQATQRIRAGVATIPEVHVLGEPDMSILSLASDNLDVYAIGDEMGLRGWHLDRQQFPPSLHLTVNYAHAGVVDEFIRDLQQAVRKVKRPSLRKTSTTATIRLAQLAVRLLPERLVHALTSRSTGMVGVKGSHLPQRSAAMYGLMASLPNRGDIHEIVLDLLDRLTRLDEEAGEENATDRRD
jgi:sphinganine-1-phosphate aldolase